MNFGGKGKVRLGGASKKEVSKEQLLRQVRVERSLRARARENNDAAVTIQRVRRGYLVRESAGKVYCAAWLKRFGQVAGDPEAFLKAEEVADELLPGLLQHVLQHFSPARRNLEMNGSPLQAVHIVDSAVVRGSLAIVLRSIASEDPEKNYCSLCSEENGKGGSWRDQCKRLLLLCAGIVGSSDLLKDGLLQAVCAQVLLIMVDRTMWKCFPADGQEGVTECDAMKESIAALPTVFASLRRLLVQKQGEGRDESLKTVSMDRTIEWMAAVCINLLKGNPQSSKPFVHFVNFLASAPNLWPKLSSHIRYAKMTHMKADLSIYVLNLMDAAKSIQHTSAAEGVWAIGNICTLVAGTPENKKQEDGQIIRYLVPSVWLQSEANSLAYVNAVSEELKRVINASYKAPIVPGEFADAVGSLAMFADRAHLMQVMGAVDRGSGDLGPLCNLYCVLLHSLQSAVNQKSHPVSLPFLNVLAFAPTFIPKLWNWIALNLRVPLDAPLEATRGWKIESVRGGFGCLDPPHAHALGLFCQVYAHLLLVLDDEDFHTKQMPVSLGQNRAVATTLNTLVFFTYCPQGKSGSAAGSVSSSNQTLEVLVEHAPLLLQRLHERDARRAFCRSTLWLGPYTESKTETGGHDFLAAAVVQALLCRTSGRADPSPSITLSSATGMANILLSFPHCLPFEERVQVFRGLITADRDANRWDLAPIEGGPPPVQVTIRRSNLFDDAIETLSKLGPRLRGRLMVTFVDDHGLEEPGMDLGGLMKELVEEVMKVGLNPDAGLFQANTDSLLYPSPLAEHLPYGPQMLKFLGQILGKALYESILLDVPLAPFFLLQLQGQTLMFDDLSTLDPELHRNLLQVKHFSGDAGDLGLDFTVEADLLGRHVVEELVAGGSNQAVTDENKLLYVHLMANWHVNVKVGRPAQTFASGLAEIIPISWLRLFSPKELNSLLTGGEETDIDVGDLQMHTEYSGGYSKTSSTITLFWKVLAAFNVSERSALLKFVTSCSRPPLGGFKHMQPPFTVHKVTCMASPLALLGGQDVDLLPSASTCYNTLKLPNYRRSSTLKKKLLLAIQSNTGFGLS